MSESPEKPQEPRRTWHKVATPDELPEDYHLLEPLTAESQELYQQETERVMEAFNARSGH